MKKMKWIRNDSLCCASLKLMNASETSLKFKKKFVIKIFIVKFSNFFQNRWKFNEKKRSRNEKIQYPCHKTVLQYSKPFWLKSFKLMFWSFWNISKKNLNFFLPNNNGKKWHSQPGDHGHSDADYHHQNV